MTEAPQSPQQTGPAGQSVVEIVNSPSVDGVVSRLGTRSTVTSWDIVQTLLQSHGEYASQRGASLAKELGPVGGEARPATEWLAAVKGLLDPNRVTTLHGRLLIVTLARLDRVLAEYLTKSDFLRAVEAEVKEPLDTLFVDRGPPRGTEELDPSGFFDRLSSSSRTALAHADGMRRWNNQDRIHMEHLVMGLFRKVGGPTERLLGGVGMDERALRDALAAAVELRLPAIGEYKPELLTELPPLSPHVRAALIAARGIADGRGSQIQSRHLLYGVLSVEECSVTQALLNKNVRKEQIDLAAEPSVDLTRAEIAGYNADAAEGTDRLGITADVEALCSVLVARDVPLPISVGLFGDWGSGKSFFMGKMRERVDVLKEAVRARGGEGAYCGNVVQIWFNAWHYMDTNLWASLAAEIFEALGRAVDQDAALAAGHGDPAQVRARLLAAAASSRDILAEAQRAKAAAEEELRSSTERLEQLRQSEIATKANLRPAALVREVYRVAVKQPDIAAKMQQAATILDLPAARASATALKAQLLELRGVVGYLRATFLYLREHPDARLRVLGVVGVGLLITFGLPPLLAGALPHQVGPWVARLLGALAAAIGVLQPVLKYVRPAMSLLNEAREAHQEAIENAQKQVRERAKAQHQAVQQKVQDATGRVEAATAALEDVERKLDALRADRQLADFIRDRQVSSDYTKHLGIVARARRDFQQLSDLLGKVRVEAPEPEPAPVGRHTPEPVASIDRVILYIDDLDRCPESNVVDVLQAVHLLLAFPLFVVVVGVDPRWLLHSLREHSTAFQAGATGESGETMESDEERLHWQSTPLNYLEKIFQIPFTLRPMGANGFGNMIDSLSAQQGQPSAPAARPIRLEQPGAAPSPVEGGQAPGNAPGTQPAQQPPVGLPSPEPVPAPVGQGVPAEPTAPAVDVNPQYLRFQDWERDFMKRVYPLIPSPRAAKRFVNLYRLLRASATRDALEALAGDEQSGEYRVVLLLLAIQTGYASQAADVIRELINSRPSSSWWTFLDLFRARAQTTNGGSGALEAAAWRDLFERVQPLRDAIPADHPCEAFVRWAPQVARYSFQSGRALLSLR